MRVVLDTNVLISACWSPGGLEARIVAMALDGRLIWCVTGAVLAEYREVAARPKFAARRECFARLLAHLDAAELVAPGPPASAATDPDDNRLLECAAGAQAHWLITGNLRHFPATWQGTRIGNARQFVTEALGWPPPESPSAGP
jgi:uncharacterized protein